MEEEDPPAALRSSTAVGRGGPAAEQTTQGISFPGATRPKIQLLGGTAEELHQWCVSAVHTCVAPWFSTHSYYAMHLFLRSAVGSGEKCSQSKGYNRC